MYKRPARVLLLEDGDGTRARWAQALANRRGRDWLTARAATLGAGRPDTRLAAVAAERGLPVDLRPCPVDQAAGPGSADLVVALGMEAGPVRAWLEECSAPRPVKAWPLPTAQAPLASREDLRRLGRQMERRLTGMVGGLRLMARQTAEPETE